MTLEEYKRWHFIPEDMDLELLERVARAMVAVYNDIRDRHVRPVTYEELRDDARHGLIQAAAAAITIVRESIRDPVAHEA